MKSFPSIPYHSLVAERLLVTNPEEAGVFEVDIKNSTFSQCPSRKKEVTGEVGYIRATNYRHHNYRRVFMHLRHRCPTWAEMAELKNLFFQDGEIAIQFHPKKSEYVNEVKTALHLWEPKDKTQLKRIQYASTIVRKGTEKIRTYSSPNRIIRETQDGKHFIAIFCGDNWLNWYDVCKIKQACFGEDCTAFQLNISKEFDLHSSKILTLWNAQEFGIHLPPSEIV